MLVISSFLLLLLQHPGRHGLQHSGERLGLLLSARILQEAHEGRKGQAQDLIRRIRKLLESLGGSASS